MQSLLKKLGVRSEILSLEEKEFLNQNGYLNLGQLLTAEQVSTLNQRLAEILEEEGERAGWELMDSPYIRHPKEKGADRLADLVNKDPLFDIFYTHPKVLAGISQVVGDELKLSSLNYRAALPGYGHQNLHADWHEPVENGEYKVCNSIWLLDDFSEKNGATRIVPGTHLLGSLPQDVLEDPAAPHPEQILIEAPAGSVFIFNSHTWHGGTINRSQAPRRAVHSYFCRRDQPQQIDQSKYITNETRERLSEAAVEVLGVEA